METKLGIIVLALVIANFKTNLAFLVKIVNMTNCRDSELELGELEGTFSRAYPFDQTFSGKITIPIDLEDDAQIEYKSSIWASEDEKWRTLFTGERSVCRSLVKSITYQKFTTFSDIADECPIKEGTYEFEDFPVSGQYVVLNTIRGVNPLVKHRLRLVVDDVLILCKVIYTLSDDD